MIKIGYARISTLEKEVLRKGDILVVRRFDWLDRILKHLIEWVNKLNQQGIGLYRYQFFLLHKVSKDHALLKPGNNQRMHNNSNNQGFGWNASLIIDELLV